MKISNKISYPYPIWGWRDDYCVGITDEDFNISGIDDKDNFIYKLELFVHNADIEKLISEGKAEYVCHAYCPSTFMAYSFTSDNPVLYVKIPRTEVNNKVDLKWMIVAKESIPDFHSSLLNPDYNGSVSFPLGAMLAYITSFEINPTICNGVRSLDEIFVVVKNTEDDTIKYTFNDRKVKIHLPEKELEIFNNYGSKYPSMMHSTIVRDALVLAISNLDTADDSLDWVYIIKQYIETFDSDDMSSSDEDEEYKVDRCFAIADFILQSPVKRMFGDIKSLESSVEAQDGTN